jgi:cytochrome c553
LPLSFTALAVTLSVQLSPSAKAPDGVMVKLLPLVAWLSGWLPLLAQLSAKAPVESVTLSLKVTLSAAAGFTPVALLDGVVAVMLGGVLALPKLWLRLQAPKVAACAACHVKPAEPLAVPPSCSE